MTDKYNAMRSVDSYMSVPCVSGIVPTETISPLTVADKDVRDLLQAPLRDPEFVKPIRHAVMRELGSLMVAGEYDGHPVFLDDDSIDNAVLCVSERVQNAIRHGGGARSVDMGVTRKGFVFIGVPNFDLNYPDEGVKHIANIRPLHYGKPKPLHENDAPQEVTLDGLDEDMHGWGEGIIDILSVTVDESDERDDMSVASGRYDRLLVDLPVIDELSLRRFASQDVPARDLIEAVRTRKIEQLKMYDVPEEEIRHQLSLERGSITETFAWFTVGSYFKYAKHYGLAV